jgi:import inner membrane translocase subunit TIM54
MAVLIFFNYQEKRRVPYSITNLSRIFNMSSPTSLLQSVKSKLPSPKAAAFWATVATLVGLKVYDKQECKRIQAELCKRAQVKAEELLPVTEKPKRVEVYLMPPPGDGLYKSVDYFEKWVKPIWDAAAMEYDVIKCRHIGEAHHRARESIKHRRRFALIQPLLTSSQQAANNGGVGGSSVTPAALQNVNDPSTVLPDGVTPEEFMNLVLGPQPVSALVALGPIAFAEILHGAAEGCALVDTRAQKFIKPGQERKDRAEAVGLTEEELELIEEEEEKERTNKSASHDEKTPVDLVTMGEADLTALVPIDWIPHKNRIGWSSIPGRMVRWFKQRELAASIGEHALRIALENERLIQAEDINIAEAAINDALNKETSDEHTSSKQQHIHIDDRIASVLRMFT